MKSSIKQAGLVVLLTVATAYGQGALTPSGVPGPTMKSLDQVEPRIPISEPGCQVTNSGSYYLTGNLELTSSKSTGIYIYTDNVTIDLNGFTIGGADADYGISCDRVVTNVVIKNGTICDCSYSAIIMTYAENCSYLDLNIHRNCSRVYPALRTGRGGIVRNCRIENNDGSGLRVLGDGYVVGNHITGNTDNGLVLSYGGNYCADNIVMGNGNNYSIGSSNQVNLLLCEVPETLEWPCNVTLAGTLVCAEISTNGITVASDNVTIDMASHTLVGPGASSGSGIYQSTDYNGLRIYNGKVTGWDGANKAGLYVHGDNTKVENVQAVANRTGVYVGKNGAILNCSANGNTFVGFSSLSGCTIADCTAQTNGSWGIAVPAGCKIQNCIITDNDDAGAYLMDSQIEDCLIQNNAEGVEAEDNSMIRNNTITGNRGNGIELTGVNNLVENNVVRNNATNYSFVAGNQLNLLLCEMPETIEQPCSVKLAGTLKTSETGVNGITVNADDVTIDMNGHALIGPGADSGSGIYQAAGSGMRVMNGSVCNWNGEGNYGIGSLGNSSLIEGVQVTSNACGIFVRAGSTLRSCIAYTNSTRGIYVQGSVVSDCTAYKNGSIGIEARYDSKVNNCVANYNMNGFSLWDSSMQNCSASDNYYDGFYLDENSRISDCTARENGRDGIVMYGSCNQVIGNDVIANGNGIRSLGSHNFIARNVACSNSVNWVITADDRCFVVEAAAAGSAFSGDSGGTSFGTSDPNANFTY